MGLAPTGLRGISRNAVVLHTHFYLFHVVRSLYREYLLIGSTSSTRTAGTRSCRWSPRASVPLPCPSDPCVCKRVRACMCMRCIGLCGRYSAWTAVSFGISALPALRNTLLRPLAATRCSACARSAVGTGRARPLHISIGTKRAHPSSVSSGTGAHPHGGRTGSLLVASAPGPNGLTPSTSAPGLPGSLRRS